MRLIGMVSRSILAALLTARAISTPDSPIDWVSRFHLVRRVFKYVYCGRAAAMQLAFLRTWTTQKSFGAGESRFVAWGKEIHGKSLSSPGPASCLRAVLDTQMSRYQRIKVPSDYVIQVAIARLGYGVEHLFARFVSHYIPL
jgi:hypothetical protein